MTLSFFFTQVLTGLTYGMLFFLIAVGLSIILGVMNVVNLSHGTIFMLGGYISLMFLNEKFNFWVSLLLSIVICVIIGVLVERTLLSSIYGKPLEQVLITFGLAFVMADVTKWIWGTQMRMMETPDLFNFSVSLGIVSFPAYRFFVLAVGCLIALLLWYLESYTRIGAIIRAGVDDRKMVSALGINIGMVFTGVFAFGAGLAAIGGVLGGPIIGLYPGMDFKILVTSLIVVVIGGLGSWKGSFFAAIVVGIIQTFGELVSPALSMIIVFLLMIVVLIVKPSGLFGRSGVM